MQSNSGDEVAVLLNNLGGMAQIEMNILAKEALEWLGMVIIHLRPLPCELIQNCFSCQESESATLSNGTHYDLIGNAWRLDFGAEAE